MIQRYVSKSTRKNGMALASVLMVSVVMLALAGAFFAAHKTDLKLMGTSIKMQKTKDAALSAADFFQYKLENDRSFGKIPFSASTESFPESSETPVLTVQYEGNGSDTDDNVVRGVIHKTGLSFEGRVLNNLDNNAVGSHDLGTTPPRTVRVWITTEQAFIVKHMDFILKRSPFSSVSVVSGADVSVDVKTQSGGAWWLGARQPSGNAVRANGTINGPEVLSQLGRGVLFEAPTGLADKMNPPYGVLQAKNLRMGFNGVPTPIRSGDSRVEEAEENILGVLSAGGAGVEVPRLDPSKLTTPLATFEMPAQTVAFRTREASEGKVVHELLENGSVVASYDAENPNERKHYWRSSDSQIAATFDLESRTMTVSPNFELTSTGQFTLQGVSSGNGNSETNQPTLILGTATEGASISAEGVDVKGSVGGKGAIKAGSSSLSIRAKSNLSTTPDFGVALHSKSDVVLSQPGASSSDAIPSDWDAFSKAAQAQKSSSLDKWMDLSALKKAELTRDFSGQVLSKPGTDAGNDPIWLSLTNEFPANEKALGKYDEWTQEYVPPVMGDDPDWVEPEEPEHPMIEQLDEDTGEPVMIPDPDWEWDPGKPPTVELEPSISAGPGMQVEHYIRMREYLKTVKSGAPDETWLGQGDPTLQSARRTDVMNLINNQLSSYQLLAGQTSTEDNGNVTLSWNPLSKYLNGESNPFLTGYSADMSFRGLVYAGGNFTFDTKEKGIEIEGALVAQGNVTIENATGARFIYNSELLENLFATNEGDTSVKLERSFWAYY